MRKAILITGASTGIGHGAAVSLAKKGYQVFACVRTLRDFDKLKGESPNITPLNLDVTKSDQIQQSYDLISASMNGFEKFHLINNAGVAVVGPVETLPVAEFKRQFEVNFFGLIEITQKFLPLIRKTKGRIINISSVSGLSSSPFLSAYSSSKFALESLSDAMRWELEASGVKVIVVEPGPVATPIWNKGFEKETDFLESIPPEMIRYYEKPIKLFAKAVRGEIKSAISVDQVSQTIEKVLAMKKPPARIIVASPSAKLQTIVSKYLPQKILDFAIHRGIFAD